MSKKSGQAHTSGERRPPSRHARRCVDPVPRIARAKGGATLGDVDHEALAHALATPLGVVSRTSVGGLMLHGGLGFLTAKAGGEGGSDFAERSLRSQLRRDHPWPSAIAHAEARSGEA
jgi:hypothetical protein